MLFLAWFLDAQQAPSPADGSVDTDVTILGRDDSIIPVPDPENDIEEIDLPAISSDEPAPVYVPVVLPPVTDSLALPPVEIQESVTVPGDVDK
jgi:hypothetical protein